MSRLLVVAGEGSGDALAAPVLERLGVPAFGFGGPLLAAAGMRLVRDFRASAAMGTLPVLQRAPHVVRSAAALVSGILRERPRAALLVGLSEVNGHVARLLRRVGTKTLWYAPPQVWAWRAGRARRLATLCDALAVVLPFEVTAWRNAGADVQYVGHPALERLIRSGGAPNRARTDLALLPGSRAHEVRAVLPALLQAADAIIQSGAVRRARLIVAPGLDDETTTWMVASVRRSAAEHPQRIEITTAPIEVALESSRLSLCTSGTATLECAALGVPPVVVYRTDPLTFAVAKKLVRVEHIALPNLVLGRRAFPELLQSDCEPESIVRAAVRLMDERDAALADCAGIRRALTDGLDARKPSERVAAMLSSWL